MSITTWPHYTVHRIESMEQVRRLFPAGQADECNWLLLHTGGVHARGSTLDDTERWLKGEFDAVEQADRALEVEAYEHPGVDVLIVHPRLCVLNYGHLKVTLEDIPYLRELVRSTLAMIAASQVGNT